MHPVNFVSSLCLLAAVSASPIIESRDTNLTVPKSIPVDTFTKITASAELIWQPCLSTFFCAVLDVPLDYQKPNGTRARVPVIKYPATKQPSQGMVFTNPGGPSGSGIESVFESGSQFASIVGTQFDIVAWEPRGLGFAEPITNCSSTTSIPGIQKRAAIPGQSLPDEFFENVLEASKDFGAACELATGGPDDAGPHMNTIVVVKDLLSVLDAYARSDDGKKVKSSDLLNYWGFSYGTVIGQMFASMFPDRIGRVVLDGVVDPDDWIVGDVLKEVTLTDEVFLSFFVYCNIAGPTVCPYYTGNTPLDIFARFERTVQRFDVEKATQQKWANASAITLGLEGLKFFSRILLYTPSAQFPQLAKLLLGYEQISQNLSIEAIHESEKQFGQNISLVTSIGPETLRAVTCTDSRNRIFNHTLLDVESNIRTLQGQSFIGGDFIAAERVNCIGWSIEAAENFQGKFGGCTKNPILFVSNTLDPITPIQNGERSAGLFDKAEHLSIEGPGHTSQATMNKCALQKIGSFFQDGLLPGNANHCSFDAEPFGLPASNATLTARGNNSEWDVMLKRMEGLRK